jgi:hypothetical protein
MCVRIRRAPMFVPALAVPEGYSTIRVTGALDSGGTNQHGGALTSVRFAIYGDAVPSFAQIEGAAPGSLRDPANAVAGLQIAPESMRSATTSRCAHYPR